MDSIIFNIISELTSTKLKITLNLSIVLETTFVIKQFIYIRNFAIKEAALIKIEIGSIIPWQRTAH